MRPSITSQSGGRDLTRTVSLTHTKALKSVTSDLVVHLQHMHAYPRIDSKFLHTYSDMFSSMGEKAEASGWAGAHTWPSEFYVSLEPGSG